jgi:hypothetical protein
MKIEECRKMKLNIKKKQTVSCSKIYYTFLDADKSLRMTCRWKEGPAR